MACPEAKETQTSEHYTMKQVPKSEQSSTKLLSLFTGGFSCLHWSQPWQEDLTQTPEHRSSRLFST